MTEQQLRELCTEWQDILRLRDWDIFLNVKRIFDMPDGCEGRMSSTTSLKIATIDIMDEIDFNPASPVPLDQEKTLVHELLHVHFSQLHDEHDSPVHLEQATEMITAALIRLKRGEKRERIDVYDSIHDEPIMTIEK